jgi:hypothetical protein
VPPKFHYIIQVKELGLRQPSFLVMELLKTKLPFHGIALIERVRDFEHGVKKYIHLSKTNDSNSLVINESTGYYVVKEEV